ncbi:MAG: transketolase [Candidatus Riflebacteria bacterium]|nr:transketolase [Candidatus Riflebacteria bacterium]
MRSAFFAKLEELAAQDDRICLIVGDLGFGVVNSFRKRFPSRFLNAGVAEQNMTGLAAGMALMGKVVFTYSIGNFSTLRCLEQIRNDVCYHNLNVKIVCVGGGVSYGAVGATHHATQDLAIMRSLPNMTVMTPNDPCEASWATQAIINQGPCYLRIGRDGEKRFHQESDSFCLGKPVEVRQGKDVLIATAGGMLKNAILAAEILERKGLSACVLSAHTLKPFDSEFFLNSASKVKAVFSLEDHSVCGGLGGIISEILAEFQGKINFKRIGLPDTFTEIVGDQSYLHNCYGLSPEKIAETICNYLSSLT